MHLFIAGLTVGLLLAFFASVFFYIKGWHRGVCAVIKNPHNFTPKGHEELLAVLPQLEQL